MTTLELYAPTLRERAARLQELLDNDGIPVTLEDCEDLLLADAVEQLKVKTLKKG